MIPAASAAVATIPRILITLLSGFGAAAFRLSYLYPQFLPEYIGNSFKRLDGGICLSGIFKALVCLIGKPQFPGNVSLALFPPELSKPEGQNYVACHGNGAAARESGGWKRVTLGNVGFETAIQGFFRHCQGFLMRKATGNDIRHIGKLRDKNVFAGIIFFVPDFAVVNHNLISLCKYLPVSG
jgi:hypothetical protein